MVFESVRIKGSVLILGLLFLATCGGGGGGGSGGSSTPAWVGKWLIQSENGVDVSALNATYTISESSTAFVFPSVCASTSSLTVTGSNWTATVQTTDCAGASVGDVNTGTFTVSGNTLTVVNNTLGVTQVCTRTSS